MSPLTLFLHVAAVLALLLASTVVFDVVHWSLHRMHGSRSGPLRRIGELHQVHHRFLDRELRMHPELLAANLRHHVVPEFLTQLSVSLLALAVLPRAVVLPVIGVQVAVFLLILRVRGVDVNHRERDRLPAYRPLYFCLPAYHALHHVHPDAHFSSWIKLFDHTAGTGTSLAGRRVALAGDETAFGTMLRAMLEDEGVASVVSIDAGSPGSPGLPDAPEDGHDAERADDLDAAADPARDLDALLARTDVLVVDPAGGGAATDPVALIERYRRATADRRVPVEVWARSHPGLDEAARRYFLDPGLLYRHLAMPGGADAARQALTGVKRGFNFVPGSGGLAGLGELLRFRRGRPPLAATGPA